MPNKQERMNKGNIGRRRGRANGDTIYLGA